MSPGVSRAPLSDAELAGALQELPGWTVEDGKLTVRRQLPSFVDALAFVQQVGELAERLDHHPDIDIRWRTVTLAVNMTKGDEQIYHGSGRMLLKHIRSLPRESEVTLVLSGRPNRKRKARRSTNN